MPVSRQELQLRALMREANKSSKAKPKPKLEAAPDVVATSGDSQAGEGTLSPLSPKGGSSSAADALGSTASQMAASSPNVAVLVQGQGSAPTDEDGQQASSIPAPSSSSELTKRVSVRTTPKQKPLTEKETSFDVLESSELEQRKRIARLNGINLDSLRSADGKPLSADDVLKVVSAGCRDETHTGTGRSGSRKSQGGASSAESLYSSPALAEKAQYHSTGSPTGRHHPVRSRRAELRFLDPHNSVDHLTQFGGGGREQAPLWKTPGFLTAQAFAETLRSYDDEGLDGVGYFDGNTMNAGTRPSVTPLEHDVRLRMGLAEPRMAWQPQQLQISWTDSTRRPLAGGGASPPPRARAIGRTSKDLSDLFSRSSPRLHGSASYSRCMLSDRSCPSLHEVPAAGALGKWLDVRDDLRDQHDDRGVRLPDTALSPPDHSCAVSRTLVPINGVSSTPLVPIMVTGRKSVQVQLFELLKGNSNRVLELFKEWDTDGNGAVDKMELRKGIAGLGYSVPKKEIDFLFDCFDKDGSGEIAYGEFKKMLSEESLAHALEAADPEMRKKAKERQLRLTRRLSRESKEHRYLGDHEEERPDSPIAFESFMLLKSLYTTRKPEATELERAPPPPPKPRPRLQRVNSYNVRSPRGSIGGNGGGGREGSSNRRRRSDAGVRPGTNSMAMRAPQSSTAEAPSRQPPASTTKTSVIAMPLRVAIFPWSATEVGERAMEGTHGSARFSRGHPESAAVVSTYPNNLLERERERMAAVKAGRVIGPPSAAALPIRIRVSATVEPPPLRAASISVVPRPRHGARVVHATLQAPPDRSPPRAGSRLPSDEPVLDELADGMDKARKYLAHRNLESDSRDGSLSDDTSHQLRNLESDSRDGSLSDDTSHQFRNLESDSRDGSLPADGGEPSDRSESGHNRSASYECD